MVLLFGVRSWQQKRATGSTGFNGFTADRAPAARVAGLSFASTLVAGLCPRPSYWSACCRC